jgi:myo-inositol-1(or 4)-monophosphatase
MSDASAAASPTSAFLAMAIDAATRAGRMQLDALGSAFAVRKKGVIDLVTEIDLAIERMCRALVAERYPDHDVLGEEFGAPDAGRPPARHCWIVDPIDGTTNFAHGMPIFCASVALEIDGRVDVAAVYDPTRDELFTAERGRGAWLNGGPLAVSANDRLVDALLVTGFPYTVRDEGEEMLGLFGAFITKARAVRRLGSAALDVCYVAAGRMDGFWEQDLKPWDIAAGTIIVEEAGGKVTDFAGEPYASRRPQLLATNGKIHEEMLAITRAFLRSRI